MDTLKNFHEYPMKYKLIELLKSGYNTICYIILYNHIPYNEREIILQSAYNNNQHFPDKIIIKRKFFNDLLK